MCVSPTPSCHHAHFHCDLLISHSVSHSACGYPDACLTWFYLFNITGPGQQWKNSGHTPNPAWHISHQIWVLVASIVFNWSVGWLENKPAVNLWPPKWRRCLFPSLSVSSVLLLLTIPLLFVFLSFCISFFAPLCNAGHQITTSK